jgi:tRNA(Ile)-lysidine synthase TilS/MesJ
MTGTDSKFRVSLAKLQCFQQEKGGDSKRVMIAWSGGKASTALLELLANYVAENRRQSISNLITVVHVQNSGADIDAMEKWIKNRYICMKFVCLPPSAALQNDRRTSTSQENFRDISRVQVLTSYAQQNGIDVCLTADTSTRLAIKTIQLTANGRGSSLAMELATEYSLPHAGLAVCRPMKEFSLHEVDYFNKQREVQTFDQKLTAPISAKSSAALSIGQLTEQFIMGLDNEYPSTVNTVIRTLGKISTNESILDRNRSCGLCGLPCERSLDGQYCYGCQTIISDCNSIEIQNNNTTTAAAIVEDDNETKGN